MSQGQTKTGNSNQNYNFKFQGGSKKGSYLFEVYLVGYFEDWINNVLLGNAPIGGNKNVCRSLCKDRSIQRNVLPLPYPISILYGK